MVIIMVIMDIHIMIVVSVDFVHAMSLRFYWYYLSLLFLELHFMMSIKIGYKHSIKEAL